MVNPHKWQHLHHQHNSTPFSLKALLSSILCFISLVSNDVKWPKKNLNHIYFNTPLKKSSTPGMNHVGCTLSHPVNTGMHLIPGLQ